MLALLACGILFHPQVPLRTHSLDFVKDGQAAVVRDCPALHITGDMTIEAWVKPEFHTDHPFKFIISKNYGGSGFDLLLIGQGEANRIQFEASQIVACAVPASAMQGTWWHIAGVVHGDRQLLYLNGVLVAQAPAQERKTNDLPLWIGASLWTGFRGCISDVRIWNVARSQSEIARWKDRRLTGRQPGLVAYWPFYEAKGRTIHDVTGHCPNGVIGCGFKGPFEHNPKFIRTGQCPVPELPRWTSGPLLWKPGKH